MSPTKASTKETSLKLDGHTLTIEDVEGVAVRDTDVQLSEQAMEQLRNSRKVVEDFLERREVVYGITTGFGKFKDVYIAPEATEELQKNFLASHSCGVGVPFKRDVVRAITLLRANALAKGFSGIRPVVVELLLNLLNSGIHPVIPEQGSVGASGDLAPLSHLALVLTGEGQAEYKGELLSGAEALKKAGLKPVTLKAKEGLALTNGTQVMSAVGCLTLLEAERLAKAADIIGAITLEALMGSKKPFLAHIHDVRPHPGQKLAAQNLMRMLEKSQIMESHKDCPLVQDAYSLRCMPQVHGASRQAFRHAREVLSIEINSATDNPLVFAGAVISGGNFHGQPLALVMDYAGMAIAELANISERRSERLVNPALSNGLPDFLTLEAGLNSGYMIAQYTAAALVSENKVLAHPACVDSIPTSANQEDHVSMGTISARKARTMLDNATRVLAIELLLACQALDLRTGRVQKGASHNGKDTAHAAPAGKAHASQHPVDHKPKDWAAHDFVPGSKLQDRLLAGEGVEAAHRALREVVPFLVTDRQVSIDIEHAEKLIRSGALIKAVEAATGTLN